MIQFILAITVGNRRPLRNKHRSKALMTVRLLDRQERVKKLEAELSAAKSEWEAEEVETRQLWNTVRSQEEQLKQIVRSFTHHIKVVE